MSGRTRIACLALLLLLVSAAVSAAPIEDGSGTKAGEPSSAHESNVPASTQIGMWIMTLLLLSASSAAMLGGGLWHRVTAVVAQRSVRDSASDTQEARAVSSPKNKSKRAFSGRRAVHERRARPARGFARRNVEQMRPRRRGGAGCRGVR